MGPKFCKAPPGAAGLLKLSLQEGRKRWLKNGTASLTVMRGPQRPSARVADPRGQGFFGLAGRVGVMLARLARAKVLPSNGG